MNEAFQVALAPLAAFWIALEGFSKTANFVNTMRDTIITGVQAGIPLTLDHRRAIYVDWCLSMIGFVGASLMFSGIVFSLVEVIRQVDIAIYGVAVFTLIGSLGFALCGVSDNRAIKRALSQAESAEKQAQLESTSSP